MRILVGIPVLYNADLFKRAIDSVLNQEDVDLLIIDNGAEQDVKDVINKYGLQIITNLKNIYVNPAWNQILHHFVRGNWDYLIIMNSDLVMSHNWSDVCRNRWKANPNEILIPQMLEKIPTKVYVEIDSAEVVTEGTAGVFITLNKKQAQMIYPIPPEIKVWFGDLWIYSILRAKGFETVIPANLFSCHAWSSTVSRVPGISEIIEQDKVAWNEIVEPLMRSRF